MECKVETERRGGDRRQRFLQRCGRSVVRPTPCRSHQFPLVLVLGYVVFPGVLRAGSTFTDCADCPQMVVVPPGSFEMGSPPGEARAGNLWRNGIGHDRANYGSDKCCGRKQEGRDLWDYTAPVGSFSPDSLGLYDILGNVWEWVEDCYNYSYSGAATDARARTDHCSSADKRVLRGGSYGDGPELLHPAYRLRGGTGGRYVTLGFRVARSLRRNAVVK